MNIAIIGSCVTRDLFDFEIEETSQFNVSLYLSRSNMASMVGESFKELIFPDKTKIKKFDDRRFIVDLNKEHFNLIKSHEWDALIIDLIDERHAMYLLDNKILTYTKSSKEYINEHLKLNEGGGRLIQPLSDEMIDMTEKALVKIKEFIEIIARGRPVFVHRAKYATHFLSQGRKMEFEPDILNKVHRWNNFLNKCYDLLLDSKFIDLSVSEENILSGGDHKWDLTPFHYDKNYYIELSKLLNSHLYSKNV